MKWDAQCRARIPLVCPAPLPPSSLLPANEVGRQLTRAHPTSSALPPIPPVPLRANEVGRQLTKYMDFFWVGLFNSLWPFFQPLFRSLLEPLATYLLPEVAEPLLHQLEVLLLVLRLEGHT